jgi:hypothetical protein
MLPYSLAKNMPLNADGMSDRLPIPDVELRAMFDISIQVMIQVGGVAAWPAGTCPQGPQCCDGRCGLLLLSSALLTED